MFTCMVSDGNGLAQSTAVGQYSAVVAVGAGRVGHILYIFLSFLSNVLSLGDC